MSMSHSPARQCSRRERAGGFTLVELLVVIGIIAILMSILIPTLSRARKQAQSLKCLANLRTLGQAMHMYASANKQYLPYPTTTLVIDSAGNVESSPQGYIWFNAVDPYLMSATAARAEQQGRTGVAAVRTYRAYKQCPVYELFEGSRSTVGQNNTQEFAKTYKMNSHLRRVPRSRTAPTNTYEGRGSQAKITDVRRTTDFVMIGDGISLDYTGQTASVFESGQFSMEVNDWTEANPAMRHMGAANILFVDGHAANINNLKKVKKTLRAPLNSITVENWQSEWLRNGLPVDMNTGAKHHFDRPETNGYSRNPLMPLIWSDPPKLYRF